MCLSTHLSDKNMSLKPQRHKYCALLRGVTYYHWIVANSYRNSIYVTARSKSILSGLVRSKITIHFYPRYASTGIDRIDYNS